MSQLSPFHIAIPVHNLAVCREFYGKVLKCSEGRSDTNWVDFNFYGHQLVIHYKENHEPHKALPSNAVDGHDVPIPHYGVVLEWEQWEQLADQLKINDIPFVIEPYVRFKGEVGEQATMFFLDPSGNALEFKAFKNIDQLFAK